MHLRDRCSRASLDLGHLLLPEKSPEDLADLVQTTVLELQEQELIVVFRHEWDTGWDAEVGEPVRADEVIRELAADKGAHRGGGKQLRLTRAGRLPRLYADRLRKVSRVVFGTPTPEQKLFFAATSAGSAQLESLPVDGIPDVSGNVPKWPNRRVPYINGFTWLSDDDAAELATGETEFPTQL